MQGIKNLLAISVLVVVTSGCNSFDDDSPSTSTPVEPEVPTTTTNIRVVHASADAPTVDILANGAVLAGLEGVDYQVTSSWIEVNTGEYDIAIEANLPGDDANVIEATLTFDEETNYEILALGSVAGGTLAPLVIDNAAAAVTAGNARVQVVHAAASAPEVDIYVTAPDDMLDGATALATAAFTEFTGQVEVTAGDYRIRITPAGSLDVVFDSGTISLTDGADLLVMATDNVGTGSSPVTLLVADGTSFFKIWDLDATADIRVAHAVADAPAVDVIANNALTLIDALPFPEATDYAAVAPGDYLIDVAADADNSIVVIDDAAIALSQGQRYTAIAKNTLAEIGLELLMDDIRSVATAAKVRIIHASPSAGDVDIYVTTDGNITDVEPAFSAVPFDANMLAETGYVELEAGDYAISVTPTGTKDAVLETGILSLVAGEVYTAIAVDGTGGGLPPQLIGLDGLAD